MRAIVHDRTLKINQYWWNTADIIHYRKQGADHIYPNKAPGMTLLSAVPFAAISAVLGASHRLGLVSELSSGPHQIRVRYFNALFGGLVKLS